MWYVGGVALASQVNTLAQTEDKMQRSQRLMLVWIATRATGATGVRISPRQTNAEPLRWWRKELADLVMESAGCGWHARRAHRRDGRRPRGLRQEPRSGSGRYCCLLLQHRLHVMINRHGHSWNTE